MIEVLTLGFLVFLILYLSHAVIYQRLPEPVRGWECSYCRKKVIGMKSELESKEWDLTGPYPYLCPDCVWLDKD